MLTPPTPATRRPKDPHVPAPLTATPPDRAPWIPSPVTPTRDRRLRDPYLLAAVLFTAYAALSVCRYRHLATRSWDLGIFEQAVRAYAHLQTPVADLKGPGFNILGDHFSPVIALLAPAYRLFPTPVTLLVAQAALFALSAVPVTRAAAGLLGRARGLALGAAYGLSWGIQRAVDFDFHEICFAVPLIAFSLEAVLTHRWQRALLWALPLVLVKEDLGLTLAAIALVVALRARRPSPRAALYALAVAAFGVLAAALTFTVLIPAFNTTDSYEYWDKVGGGPLTGIGAKLHTLAWLLIPTTGLLALRSPLLLAALPTLTWRFLSSDEHYWGTDWHYSAVLMPVFALALADSLARTRYSPRPWLRSYALHLPAASVAAALALTTTLPLSVLTEPDAYRKPARVSAVERMLALIPDGASVEANTGPGSRLTSRCRVFWVGRTDGIAPDFIALDNKSGWVKDVQAYARQLHPHAGYEVTGAAYGYVLLERRR
ncbi:DUF2079 domain-containing protein [Streptomyces sp. NBC_00827]|uniref:DUF2079 domain-containing protein n=1 Tax=Streptomyces sp. NBC_00827 TaxID=2903677 RepID=UPI00386E5E1B|nr:DUF2079 domain-containing protein [Streptomyces sp. NBC_00827]